MDQRERIKAMIDRLPDDAVAPLLLLVEALFETPLEYDESKSPEGRLLAELDRLNER